MSKFKNPITSIINQIVALLLFRPSVLFILTAPSAFLLFAPKEYADLFLNNPNLPENLNPWIGLTCLYFGTGLIVYIAIIILRIVFDPLIWWYRRNYDEN